MHRFFIDSNFDDRFQIEFSEEISNQITRVFRMREGDQVIGFNGKGKEAVIDILSHKIIKSKKDDKSLKELINYYKSNEAPPMPINADFLMQKYKMQEGKQLGEKLRIIEEEWVKNNFKISDQQIDNIVNS